MKNRIWSTSLGSWLKRFISDWILAQRKNLHKALANRILPGMKGTICNDLVDFILEIRGWFYVRKFVGVTYHTNKLIERKIQ